MFVVIGIFEGVFTSVSFLQVFVLLIEFCPFKSETEILTEMCQALKQFKLKKKIASGLEICEGIQLWFF